MDSQRPRKQLPIRPNLEHLQKQAKRRTRSSGSLNLTAAQHELAREYGCRNWAELAEMVESMAKSRASDLPQGERYAPLPKAARARDFSEVRRLLEAGAYTPNDLDQSLAHVLWYGESLTWPQRKEAADLLLEFGADPDGQYGSAGYGPLVFGTGECIQPEGLRYLIEAGADVSFPPIQTKYGFQCPLSYILGTYSRGSNDRKHEYIELLLKQNPFIPPEVTPPVLAIHRGDAAQLGRLIDEDPSIATRRFADLPYGNIDLCGATLLHYAVEFGEVACIAELLRRGADVNARAHIGGQTPIFHALSSSPQSTTSAMDFLITQAQSDLDLTIRATFRRFGEMQSQPITVLELADLIAAQTNASSSKDVELLRGMASDKRTP